MAMAEVPVETKKTAPAPMSDPFRSLRSEMDRLFDRFAHGFGMPSWRGIFGAEPAQRYESSFSFPTPAVEVTEDDKVFKITAELPGLEQKDIGVIVSGDTLTLKGEKRYEKDEKDKDRHMSERAYGSFQRSFTLPDSVDRDKIAAELAKGVLTITLPKSAAAQKPEKKIEIKTAA
jgi:HSP20 family protein